MTLVQKNSQNLSTQKFDYGAGFGPRFKIFLMPPIKFFSSIGWPPTG
jgi:hypothetical protein